jgi:hypothetical protein
MPLNNKIPTHPPLYIVILLSNIKFKCFCLEINTRMMNKCTGYLLDNFVRTTIWKTSLPKFTSMENNLTATIIIYYIIYIWIWSIPSTQTNFIPQHKLFLCGYAVLNWTVWYIINWAQGWNCTVFSGLRYIIDLCYSNACSSNSVCMLLNS